MSGLPAVGKSALAVELGRRLPACVISVDPIEAAMWRSGSTRSFETGLAAYEVGSTVAAHQLALGFNVIADAANYRNVGREIWERAAAQTLSPIRVIHVMCSDEEVHRNRLAIRQRDIEGFTELTWEEVQQRDAESEAWREDHFVVDSLDPLNTIVAACLAYIGKGRNDTADLPD